MLLLAHHDARDVLWGTFLFGVLAEIVATDRRKGDLPPAAPSRDRGTKHILVYAMLAGLLGGAVLVRYFPSLRVGADDWSTYAIGLVILLLGIGLRVWAVWSLGRYFRREITIEPGQTVHTSGPYRFIRHPAYLGDLLIVFGFVLAWGSWIVAAAAVGVALLGHLPRIRVEEATLREALGEPYERYASRHARLLPGVW
jgi:protein-S-isoprenylcysteine O-methyltransferase Ste14